MADYEGIRCPICDIPFKKDDDIVVCPSCGAPYHRHCYQEKGHCIYEAEHGSGKGWQPPKPPDPPDISTEIKDKECAVCGTLNAHSALFCNRCGSSLVGDPKTYQNTPPPSAAGQPQGTPPIYGFGAHPFSFDPMGGVSPTEKLDDNVTFGDVSKLVKTNTGYYMPVFRRIVQTKHKKFSFCAFLFSGPWMLYRKQYKLGTIFTILIFGLYIAYTFTSLYVSTPVLLQAMETAGVELTSAGLTYNDYSEIANVLMTQPILYLQVALPLICLLFMLIIMIICGVMGNKWYMKHCIRTIKQIKEKEDPADVNNVIDAKGGVNLAIAICLFISYSIISSMPSFFLNYG